MGGRHSISAIADTTGTMLSLRYMKDVLSLDPSVPAVTVQGGATYGDLLYYIDGQGFALADLPSSPDVSLHSFFFIFRTIPPVITSQGSYIVSVFEFTFTV